MLEVGAGLGIVSCFLASRERNITSLEPGGVGFEENRVFATLVHSHLKSNHQHLPLLIEEVSQDQHGKFDFIFSSNVIEHVASVEQCLTTLHAVLRPGGTMMHNCPNYFVPYEPHFCIPLVPFIPSVTRFLIPSSMRESSTWRSLNFIMLRDVKGIAHRLGADVQFEHGLLADAFARFETDPEFCSRQKVLASLYPWMKKFGVMYFLRKLPPLLTTPMVFLWRREAE